MKLQVTSIKYQETRRGLAYQCNTNVDGVTIYNDGNGAGTFLEGSSSDIKPYRELSETDLEILIDEYEQI